MILILFQINQKRETTPGRPELVIRYDEIEHPFLGPLHGLLHGGRLIHLISLLFQYALQAAPEHDIIFHKENIFHVSP